jgi:hypothetical protein
MLARPRSYGRPAGERTLVAWTHLRQNATLDVLESENRKYEAIALGKSGGRRIVARGWWISAAL